MDQWDFSQIDAIRQAARQASEAKAAASQPAPAASDAEQVDAFYRAARERHQAGDLQSAVQLYQAVVDRAPRHDEALHLLGICALQGRQPQQAVEFITRAIQLNPKAAAPYNNRGRAYALLGRTTEALADFDLLLSQFPDQVEAHYNRGSALLSAGRPAEAEAAFDRVLALQPGQAAALIDRGTARKQMGRLGDALADYDAVIALDAANAIAWFNRGSVLKELGRTAEARDSYAQTAALQPGLALARLNHAALTLLTGDFEAGFQGYEWRRRCPGFADDRIYLRPEWSGFEDIKGCSLFIYPELFLGDLIQFSRYARLARARGAQVTLGAPAAMHALLRTLDPAITLVTPDVEPPADWQCALMSLPLAFGTTLQDVPAEPAYLAAEPERVARWAARIGQGGLRIGVCSEGGAALRGAFPVAALAPVAGLPDVRLIGLQKPEALPQGLKVEWLGEDFEAGPDLFLDTAAAMKACDLVIAADTAAAHLAGALGVPTWLALPYAADWRWLEGRDDSPWYPSMRLFRQPSRGDWAGVFAAMAQAIPAFVESRL